MKNIPRIFIDENLKTGKIFPISKEQLHYLQKVMRTDECLIFNKGSEFLAKIVNYELEIISKTDHIDPSNNLTLAFAPIKNTDELVKMATQMGISKLLPVVTDFTNARHINWNRMRKIAIESSEQSGRNSVPEILPEIKFDDFVKNYSEIIFADERTTRQNIATTNKKISTNSCLFIGPEGGFSDSEFSTLDKCGALSLSLGKTILRAEVAAVVAISKVINN